jgi:hypothetical protein
MASYIGRRELLAVLGGAAAWPLVLRPERPPRSSSAICYVTLRPEGVMACQETFVQRDQDRIYVQDHPGAERRSFSCTGSRTTPLRPSVSLPLAATPGRAI